MLKENVKVVAQKNEGNGKRMIDYYLILSDGTREYLITRPYYSSCYEVCKKGIRLDDLLRRKKKDWAVMQLVDTMRRLEGCIRDEYELEAG